MAASAIPKPGTKYGPCVNECQHNDCKQLRQIANATCPLCHKPIGYNNRFYNDDQLGYVHAPCLETHFDQP